MSTESKTYQERYDALNAAREKHGDNHQVTLELDDGRITLSVASALAEFEILSPGESFEIVEGVTWE